MACLGFPLQRTECLGDGVGDRPVKLEDLSASSPGELDAAHLSLGATSVEIPTQIC
ncbi:MAG TPA: hypothetical protein VK217_03400 [Acidimicrobiales bacterium]|nr:hypothetical protein [Acidimicrobiales bacterium]